MKKIIYLLIAICSISVSAQVGIGVDTAQINASAQLDVSSTTKGFLAPRMTSAQKAAIVNPALGLLVYQTDVVSGFYYYNGTAWTAVSGGSGIPYTGATEAVNLGAYDLTVNGVTIGKGAANNEFNTAIGSNALAANTIGQANTAIGMNTLNLNTEGIGNTAIGLMSLTNNTIGVFNTAIGSFSLKTNAEGGDNTAIGSYALGNNTSGNENTSIGYESLKLNDLGNNNTAIGNYSLSANLSGTNNTAIGYEALAFNASGSFNTALGYSADVTSQLLSNATAIGYDAKVAASNTIQLGNTVVTAVKTSGKLTTGSVTYPNTNGTANQVLTTDGAGNASWEAAATGTPGVDLTTNQTVDGLKTFSSDLTVNGLTIGRGAAANEFNTVLGSNALAANTTGFGNIAIGINTLNLNTEGNLNTALGPLALSTNTTGSSNTAIGATTLYFNTTGSSNTATGMNALTLNDAGSGNTANGAEALSYNNHGNDNTAIGHSALSSNGSGSDNTAIGTSSLSRSEGSGNSAIGAGSLAYNMSGNNNTAIGKGADVLTEGLSNTTTIGYNAKVAVSNTIQLGNAAITAVKTSGQLTTGTVTYPNTNGTANQVLTTDGAGVASWTTAAVVTPGIDLTTDQTVGGLKTFNSNDGLLATGAFMSGAASSLGAGTRMMWYPKKAAFRAGYIDNNQWDDSNIGNYSTSMGQSSTASGEGSTAIGFSNQSTGNYSVAIGYLTTANDFSATAFGRETLAYANTSTAMGYSTRALANYSTAFGNTTTASGESSTASGSNTIARSLAETVIGSFNTDYTPASTSSFSATDRLFVIGNGIDGAQSDALVMLKNGNTTFSGQIKTGTVTYPNTNGTANQVLTTNGAGVASWATVAVVSVNLTTGVTGILPVANGGTGVATSTGTVNTVLSESPTLTGIPLAPTANAATNTDQIATTAFVATAVTAAAIRDVTDEFTATVSQTIFTLAQTKSANSKVKMYINGIRISNTAYGVIGTTLTYVPANNGTYTLTAGDRIQFDYFY